MIKTKDKQCDFIVQGSFKLANTSIEIVAHKVYCYYSEGQRNLKFKLYENVDSHHTSKEIESDIVALVLVLR